MKHVTNIARYLLALMLLVFGLNKFLKFMPMPELPEQAQAYMAALGSTGILFPLLGIIYLLTAVTLVLNRYAALMLLVLTPVTVNI
ncbi:MAG: DoxX protein, partial [Verrucomicrobia bacterium]|nr:DoxX protein [Verrucomicrobiota bacterium]